MRRWSVLGETKRRIDVFAMEHGLLVIADGDCALINRFALQDVDIDHPSSHACTSIGTRVSR